MSASAYEPSATIDPAGVASDARLSGRRVLLLRLALGGILLLLCSPLVLRPAVTAGRAALDGAISHPFDAQMAVGFILALSVTALQLGAVALIWAAFVAECRNLARLMRADPRLVKDVQERYSRAASKEGFQIDDTAVAIWRSALSRSYLPMSWALLIGTTVIPTYVARHAPYALGAMVMLPLALAASNGIWARRLLKLTMRQAHPGLPTSRWTAADVKELTCLVITLAAVGGTLSTNAWQSGWGTPRAEEILVVRDAQSFAAFGAGVRAAARAALPDRCGASEETASSFLDTTTSDEQFGRELRRAAGERAVSLGVAGTASLQSDVLFAELLGTHRTVIYLCGARVDGPRARFAPEPPQD